MNSSGNSLSVRSSFADSPSHRLLRHRPRPRRPLRFVKSPLSDQPALSPLTRLPPMRRIHPPEENQRDRTLGCARMDTATRTKNPFVSSPHARLAKRVSRPTLPKSDRSRRWSGGVESGNSTESAREFRRRFRSHRAGLQPLRRRRKPRTASRQTRLLLRLQQLLPFLNTAKIACEGQASKQRRQLSRQRDESNLYGGVESQAPVGQIGTQMA